jgi:2-polyprenyl-6-methoxyphenol hydroxylase-like FAD-dependent oxidoreductase
MSKRRALIIGGSLAGLFTAHLLRLIGWTVDVFERASDDLAGRGAGIGTHDVLIEIARRIGLSFDGDRGVITRTYACLDRGGQVLHEIAQQRVMSAWGAIYRPLKMHLPAECYHAGRALSHVATHGDVVTAWFADGSQETADLLIAADGFRSTVREQFLPLLQPSYAGYVAWRAMVRETDMRRDDAIFERLSFSIPVGELAVSYPVPGHSGDTRKGHRAYNIVWYRPADSDLLADLCTDTDGRRHDAGIPPARIRLEILKKLQTDGLERLARPIAEALVRAELPFFHPIYDLASPQLTFGRVVLLGDAAFVARPHVGAGVTKAALDAACLTDAIVDAGNDLDQALARYSRERGQFGDWIVARGRDMGRWIAKPGEGKRTEESRDRQLEILREYVAMARDIHELHVHGYRGTLAGYPE